MAKALRISGRIPKRTPDRTPKLTPVRTPRLTRARINLAAAALAVLTVLAGAPVAAQQAPVPAVLPAVPANPLTYADLVDLAQAAELVLKVQVNDQRRVEPERAPGLLPGQARLYLQARTQALVAGAGPAAERYAFLTDVPVDLRGRPPQLKRGLFLLFARRVAGRPGELQLVGPGAMQPVDPAFEARLRLVLTQVVQGARPPVITGVREAISVPGNLAGESETQIFLATNSGQPVSLTVVRRPGMAPTWGVSWSEIVDQSARPPAPQTVAWYRLACALPARLPVDAFLQQDQASRRRAETDYAFIVEQLGDCPRARM